MGLDISAFKKYTKDFEQFEKDFNKFIKNFVISQGAMVVADAKNNTPPYFSKRPEDSKSTGNFRNSFFWDNYKRTNNEISIRINNSAEYASFLEYGFHIKGGEGRQQIVGFKDGYFVLTKSINKIDSKIENNFEQAFIAFLKEKGII